MYRKYSYVQKGWAGIHLNNHHVTHKVHPANGYEKYDGKKNSLQPLTVFTYFSIFMFQSYNTLYIKPETAFILTFYIENKYQIST